ncbi:MAG TPA: hypothetical protein DIU01_11505 [Flavobacterium sp.]|nr:hypothetical protein [Flavobacterium sp.]
MDKKKVFRLDYAQTKSLVKAGKIAATNALRHSKALDLSITFIDKGVVYEELPNGAKNVVATIETPDNTVHTFRKGMILHAK